jgi:hypothetical protein
MSMSEDNLETFYNFCKSLAEVHIKWMADPKAHERETLETTITDFLADSRNFFELEGYKTYKNHPACIQLKKLNEVLETYYFDGTTSSPFSPTDPEWIEIQTLAKKTLKSLYTLINEKE